MHGHEVTGSDATMGTFVSLFSIVVSYAVESVPTLHTVALVAATVSGFAAAAYHCLLVYDKLRARFHKRAP